MDPPSAADYNAYNEEVSPLRIHSDAAGASLSMVDTANNNNNAEHQSFQEIGLLAAILSLTGLLALASVVTAAGAMVLEASTFIYICFSCPIILAPIIVYQRSKLERNPSE